MRQVIATLWNGSCHAFTDCDTVFDVKSRVFGTHTCGSEDVCYVVCQGKVIPDEASIPFDSVSGAAFLHVHLRLRGGKGGFGSLLKKNMSMGKKVTNFDACRDLQGRRVRHSRGERELAEWFASRDERAATAEEAKSEKKKAKEAEWREKEATASREAEAALRKGEELVDVVEDAIAAAVFTEPVARKPKPARRPRKVLGYGL
jgi:telomere stability and silencing protein Sde2